MTDSLDASAHNFAPSAEQNQDDSWTAEGSADDSMQLRSEKDEPTPASMLNSALQSLGQSAPDASRNAESLAKALKDELYIATALQLITALHDTGHLFEDLRRHLKGSLLAKVKDEGHIVLDQLSKHAPKPPPPQKVVLEVRRVDLTQLSAINQRTQSFRASCFVQFAFPGGNLDPALRAESDAFPLDAYRRPTFRPSANWFLQQIDFQTAKGPLITRMSKVTKDTHSEDLLLNKRIDGEFFDEFDGLVRFPFDTQELAITVVVQCALQGMTPVEIAIPDNIILGMVDRSDFAARNSWELDDHIDLSLTTVTASKSRRFPALSISVAVRRRPFFYLTNVVAPMGLFSLLGATILLLPITFPPSRLSYLISLALTVVAYKLSTSNMIPVITYLTLLDKYLLTCSMIIILACFESAIVGAISRVGTGDETDELERLANAVDWVTFAVACTIWIAVHVWLWYRRCEAAPTLSSLLKGSVAALAGDESNRNQGSGSNRKEDTRARSFRAKRLKLAEDEQDYAVLAQPSILQMADVAIHHHGAAGGHRVLSEEEATSKHLLTA